MAQGDTRQAALLNSTSAKVDGGDKLPLSACSHVILKEFLHDWLPNELRQRDGDVLSKRAASRKWWCPN